MNFKNMITHAKKARRFYMNFEQVLHTHLTSTISGPCDQTYVILWLFTLHSILSYNFFLKTSKNKKYKFFKTDFTLKKAKIVEIKRRQF